MLWIDSNGRRSKQAKHTSLITYKVLSSFIAYKYIILFMHNLEQSCRGPDDNQEGFNTIRNITNEVNICYSLNSCEIPENEFVHFLLLSIHQ